MKLKNNKIYAGSIFIFLLLLLSSGTVYSQVEKESRAQESRTQRMKFDFDCAAKIFILDSGEDETDYLSFALWEDILDINSTGLYNADEDFNEEDIDRFYIEMKLPGEPSDEIAVDIVSKDADDNEVDQINELVLTRTQGSRFRSEAILLVMENDMIDDDFDNPTVGAFESTWDNEDDGSLDPTIYGKMGGKIEASYTQDITTETDVCPPAAVKNVALKVYVMKDADGEPFVSSALVTSQIEMTKVLFQQACLKINTVSIEEVTPGNSIDLSDGLTIADNPLVESQELNNLITQVKDTDDMMKIDIIFIGSFDTSQPTNGYAARDEIVNAPFSLWDSDHARTCIIAGENLATRPFVTAHEVGHILTNRGHYIQEYNNPEPGTVDDDDKRFFNLMKGMGTSNLNTVVDSKRLWGFQVDWARSMTDIPQ